MRHVLHPGKINHTLILLHGTGGNEHDLIEIGSFINPDANLLGIRGNILENGMPRFFKRLAFGIFDEDNLIQETHRLKKFIEEAVIKYDLDPTKLDALGYSNGANILASLLFFYPDTFQKVMLLHPMVPLKNYEVTVHENTELLITSGKNDEMVNSKETSELIAMFKNAQVKVEHYQSDFGHQITKEELIAIKEWYDKTK